MGEESKERRTGGIVRRGVERQIDDRKLLERPDGAPEFLESDPWRVLRDRKSTRLNSSHGYISYAVFCLKKKKGDLYDGTKMDGPRGLQQALLKHSDVFLLSFTENLMTYALGRRMEYTDMPAIRAIIRDAGKNNLRMSSFVLGLVNSAAFRMAKP